MSDIVHAAISIIVFVSCVTIILGFVQGAIKPRDTKTPNAPVVK